jgi:HSP20 family protein
MYDSGNTFKLLAEVPGIAKEDLNVKSQGNYLELSGTRQPDCPEGYRAHHLERGTESFSRSFTLPFDVDGKKVEAAKPRQIEIRAT